MSQAVNILIGVIEQMNLSSEDRLMLADMLHKGVTAKKPLKPKKMTAQQLFHKKFEKWAIETKTLYPPKK